jgi:hypothetical protein
MPESSINFRPDGMQQQSLLFRYIVTGTRDYAWQAFKNFVKFFLGRKPYPDERLLFFRQFVLHKTGFRPIRAITCGYYSVGEGPCSHAHLVMNAINFSRASGLPYVHTPFKILGHADRPMDEWAAAWETLFNFGESEATCDIERRDVANYHHNWSNLELCFGWRGRKEELTQSFKALLPEFRRKYYLNKSPRATNEVTVAVHIRRGDVPASNPHMFTSTETILKTVRAVKSILESHKVPFSIRIYSQGDVADFAELIPLGVEFFLNADPIWTMEELIEADILIMAKSLYSFYAGLISDGIKIFEPRSLPYSNDHSLPSLKFTIVSQSEDWLPRQTDGSIDQAAFARQLHLLMQAKREHTPSLSTTHNSGLNSSEY